MVSFHFKFLQEHFRGGKGGTFMVGPGRPLASLRHYMREQIIPICIEVYTSIITSATNFGDEGIFGFHSV